MKRQVHPVVAVIVILLVLGVVAFLYLRVFTGQVEGTIGPPSGVALPEPPRSAEEGPQKPPEKPAPEKP